MQLRLEHIITKNFKNYKVFLQYFNVVHRWQRQSCW